MCYSGCSFNALLELIPPPCYFTFMSMGKLALNCVRSAGTHTLRKMGPNFILTFVAVASYILC
jgi:hypothetical protein